VTVEQFYKMPKKIMVRPDLPPAAKLVYAVIRSYIGTNGHCWAGVRRLAQDTGLGKVTVIRAIKTLEEEGLLVAVRRGNGKVNHYQLPDETGIKMIPVTNRNRYQNDTTSGIKMVPEAVSKRYRNRKRDLLNRNNKRGSLYGRNVKLEYRSRYGVTISNDA